MEKYTFSREEVDMVLVSLIHTFNYLSDLITHDETEIHDNRQKLEHSLKECPEICNESYKKAIRNYEERIKESEKKVLEYHALYAKISD